MEQKKNTPTQHKHTFGGGDDILSYTTTVVNQIKDTFSFSDKQTVESLKKKVEGLKGVITSLYEYLHKVVLYSSISGEKHIDHNFKGPINRIKGLLEVLGYEDTLNDPETCAMILQTMNRNFTDFQNKVDLYKKVGLGIDLYQSLEKISGMQIRKDVELLLNDVDKTLVIDRHIWSIIEDAVDNSYKYGGDKMSNVTIFAKKEGGFLLIEIKDDGQGMKKSVSNSTGIGLSSSKSYIEEQRGGQMFVESSDQGTIVKLKVPVIGKVL